MLFQCSTTCAGDWEIMKRIVFHWNVFKSHDINILVISPKKGWLSHHHQPDQMFNLYIYCFKKKHGYLSGQFNSSTAFWTSPDVPDARTREPYSYLLCQIFLLYCMHMTCMCPFWSVFSERQHIPCMIAAKSLCVSDDLSLHGVLSPPCISSWWVWSLKKQVGMVMTVRHERLVIWDGWIWATGYPITIILMNISVSKLHGLIEHMRAVVI